METYRLEECCYILDSQRVPITESERQAGNYPYYGANGVQDYVSDYLFDDELVLLAEDGGNFGSKTKPIAYRVSGKCWVNNHAHVLKPKSNVNVDYLCYSLMFYNVKSLVNGATRQKLTQAAMRQMVIPKRNIQEQELIVCKLQSVQAILNARKEQLSQLDTLIKARFVEMFGEPIQNPKGWEIARIGDIVSEVRYGTSRPAVEGGKYPYLRMNNLTYDGQLDLTDLKYIDIPNEEIDKCIVHRGDVLFNRTNSVELVGKTVAYDLPEDMVIAGYIIRVRLKECMLPEVLSQYMNLKQIKDMLKGMAKGAVNQANINAQELQGIRVYIPEIGLQQDFLKVKHQVDKSKLAVQKSLEEMQLLFDSLMQEYFG